MKGILLCCDGEGALPTGHCPRVPLGETILYLERCLVLRHPRLQGDHHGDGAVPGRHYCDMYDRMVGGDEPQLLAIASAIRCECLCYILLPSYSFKN